MKKSVGGFIVVIVLVVAAVFFFTDNSNKSQNTNIQNPVNGYSFNGGIGKNALSNNGKNTTTFPNNNYNNTYTPTTNDYLDFNYSPSYSTVCPNCVNGKRDCFMCDGTGSMSKTHTAPSFGYGTDSTYQTSHRCAACRGTGKIPCTYCGGDGFI